MNYSYDDYLAQRVEDYMNSFCDGEPKVIAVNKEYEFTNEDGSIETSDSYTYSCEECDNKECEHWHEFHKCEPDLKAYRKNNDEIKWKYTCTECDKKDCEFWQDYN